MHPTLLYIITGLQCGGEEGHPVMQVHRSNVARVRALLLVDCLCYNSRVSTLYLVATPIGNLKDITLRAIEVLKAVKLIAAEDTRRSRVLLKHHGIDTPLVSYHDHNKEAREPQLLQALNEGDLALISDAGMPVVSDPGYELVQSALAHGHLVVPIPGASAPIAALSASGMPSDRFTFLGYMPRRREDRDELLAPFRKRRETLVLFEVPHRLVESLEDLSDILGAERQAAVCRELTKLHEDIQRGTLADLVALFRQNAPPGELTLVIAGAPRGTDIWLQEDVKRALNERLDAGMSPSAAAREVARISGWKRQDVYQLSLEES